MDRSSTLFLVGLGVLVVIVLVLLLVVLPAYSKSDKTKKTNPHPVMTGPAGPLVVTQFSEIPAFSANRLSADAFIFVPKDNVSGLPTPYLVQGEGFIQYTISPAILESQDGKAQYEVFYNDLIQGYPVFMTDNKLQMVLSLKGIDGDAAFEMLYNSRIDGVHVDTANADLRTRSLNITLNGSSLQMLALALNPELTNNSDNSIPNPISMVIGIKDPTDKQLSDKDAGTLVYDPASSFSLTRENLPQGAGTLLRFNFPNISMVYKPRRNCIRLRDMIKNALTQLPSNAEITFKLSTAHTDYPLWPKLRNAFANMVGATSSVPNSLLFTVPEQADKAAVIEGFFSILCAQLWNAPSM